MTISIASILRLFKLSDIISVLLTVSSTTDILGYFITWLVGQYKNVGREGVIRLVSIREASLSTWAKNDWEAVHGKGDPRESAFVANLLAKAAAFAQAFADFVGAFIPDAPDAVAAEAAA